jgi:hypothetical protein
METVRTSPAFYNNYIFNDAVIARAVNSYVFSMFPKSHSTINISELAGFIHFKRVVKTDEVKFAIISINVVIELVDCAEPQKRHEQKTMVKLAC